MKITALRGLTELGRTQYHPSGDVDWGRMEPRLVLGLSGGVAIAAALWYLDSIGRSYVIINAMGAAAAAAFIARWLIIDGHCRNPTIALLIGFPIGLISYLGFYQARLIELGGWQMAYRIDLLPSVVWNSWNTQEFVFEKVGGRFEYQFLANIVEFWFELVIVVGLPAASAQQAARQVFSEQTQHWAQSATILLLPDVIPWFHRAAQLDEFADFFANASRWRLPEAQLSSARCAIILEYTDGETPTGYLTVVYIGMFSKRIVHQLTLFPQEFDVCRHVFSLA